MSIYNQSPRPIAPMQAPSTTRQNSIPNWLQSAYQAHRSEATQNAPAVSGTFFDTWRAKGLTTAMKFFVKREREVGSSQLPPVAKIGAIVLGFGLVASSDKIAGHKNHNPDHAEVRHFSARDKLLGAGVLAAAGAVLLVAGSGGGEEPYEEWTVEQQESELPDITEGPNTAFYTRFNMRPSTGNPPEGDEDIYLPDSSSSEPKQPSRYLSPNELREWSNQLSTGDDPSINI